MSAAAAMRPVRGLLGAVGRFVVDQEGLRFRKDLAEVIGAKLK
jgi:hypothetical protein